MLIREVIIRSAADMSVGLPAMEAVITSELGLVVDTDCMENPQEAAEDFGIRLAALFEMVWGDKVTVEFR